uniref:C2 domain-containing protein n=1 Tax=Zooxanthella nutricula TaxID=1333877 RepID=A0A7S2VMA3_9DINO
MGFCCGARDAEETAHSKEAAHRHSQDRASGESANAGDQLARQLPLLDGNGAGATVRLTVRVVKAEGLLGMDIAGIDARNLSLARTLDALVSLTINDEEQPFGKTNVQWRSRGDPVWNEKFQVDIRHPRSYLCLSVLDDNPVFREGTALAWKQSCGFLEVPLWSLPRNRAVAGWFALNHPDIADNDSGLADRQEQLARVQSEETAKPPESAGRVKLELLLEMSFTQEVRGYLTPAPTFQASPPPLDLPGLLEDISEVRRLIFERLVLPPISAVMYAISWENLALTFAVVSCYWFLFFRPRFLWATVLSVCLLCFWHDIPEAQEEVEVQEDVGGGRRSLLRPVKTGIFLVDRVTKGVASVTNEVTRQVARGAGAIKDGVGDVIGVFGQIRGPNLTELQNLLLVMPGLSLTFRHLQPRVTSVRSGLESLDNMFYWGEGSATASIVKAVTFALVASVICSSYMGALSWYLFLLGGTFMTLTDTPVYKAPCAIMKASSRPQVPFKDCQWFELDE